MERLVEPEQVLERRQGLMEPEFLIQWKHLPTFEATWEPLSLLQAQFPEFHLGDKVFQKGEGAD